MKEVSPHHMFQQENRTRVHVYTSRTAVHMGRPNSASASFEGGEGCTMSLLVNKFSLLVTSYN